jgi:hypothetical protein
MISPLNFDKTVNLPPQQFKIAVVQVLNELISQANREESFRLSQKEVPPPKNKGGRPSGSTRKVL